MEFWSDWKAWCTVVLKYSLKKKKKKSCKCLNLFLKSDSFAKCLFTLATFFSSYKHHLSLISKELVSGWNWTLTKYLQKSSSVYASFLFRCIIKKERKKKKHSWGLWIIFIRNFSQLCLFQILIHLIICNMLWWFKNNLGLNHNHMLLFMLFVLLLHQWTF